MKKLVSLFILVFVSTLIWADNDTFPTSERLFHIERSKNKNIICYDVKLADNRLDVSSPIDVYWINREEKYGQRNGLTSIQRKFAFGYKVKSKNGSSADVTLNACPDRVVTIEHDGDKYRCTVDIAEKKAVLQKIYVKTKDKNSMKVEYVELIGYSIESDQIVKERIYN